MSLTSIPFFLLLCCVSFWASATSENTPDAVLDAYFNAVSQKDMDAVLSVFAPDAVIVTAGGEYRGHQAIAGFYRKGVFQCKQFKPNPGSRFHSSNQIAVEIALECDGEVRRVGDFFTVEHGKLIKMAVYSGPGYLP